MAEPSKRAIVCVFCVTMFLILISLLCTSTMASAAEQDDVIKAQEFHIQTLRGRLSQCGKERKMLINSFSAAVKEADDNVSRLYRICLSIFFCMAVLCIVLTVMGYFVGVCRSKGNDGTRTG